MISPADSATRLRWGGPARWLVLTPVLTLLTGAISPTRADVLRLLANDREAAQARVDLIQQARQDINVAYYAVDCGRIPAVLLQLLRDRARQGVRVRLLVDGLETQLPAAIQSHLMGEGVEIRQYHPVAWSRPGWLNRRMHDKLLIVDGKHLIIGSRNLQDHHFGLECVNFVDHDAYVHGQAAVCARDYFLRLWDSPDVRLPRAAERPGFRPRRPQRADEGYFADGWRQGTWASAPLVLDTSAGVFVGQQFVQLRTGYDWSAGQADDVPVQFLCDQNTDKRPGSMRSDILALIDQAEQRLVIETPYPTFSAAMLGAVLAARSRGVQVVLLTNSLATSDSVVSYATYQNEKRLLLRAGVELWEYAGNGHLHAKSLLIDDRVAVIGSYNFDVRSEIANLEVAVVARDVRAAAALGNSIAGHLVDAWRIGCDGRPVGADSPHPGAEQAKIRKLQRQRVVAPLIRRLL